MKNNDLLFKISHNRKLLFIVPNLVYGYRLFYYYNSNMDVDHILEVSFIYVLGLLLIFFLINSLVFLFVNKALKDKQKVFSVMCFISFFYFFKFNLISFLLFIVFVLILIINFKKFIKFKLDTFVGLFSFVTIILFSFSFIMASFNCCYNLIRSKSFDNSIDINVSEDRESPNIYYIHCDGMMGISAIEKYFNYNDVYLTNYFRNNDYFLNEDASFVNGRKTQRSLVALFNPYYYDNFYGDYLSELEDVYMDRRSNTSFNVSYYELEDKRLNNELFRAFESKGYTTIGIGEFNQYTSFDTDYYYDFYVHSPEFVHLVPGKEWLRSISSSNSDLRKLSYIRFMHSRSILDNTMFYNLLGDFNYLEYDNINYNNYDYSDYRYINNTTYWPAKAILKSLDMSMKVDDKKLVFIDYNLNHLYLTYDIFGNRLSEDDRANLNYYDDNYIYSSYLLVDMLEFIRNNDPDGVIVIEGDHGIHVFEDEEIMEFLDVDRDSVEEIRNSVISSIYVPSKYRNGDEKHLDNPLNISRYLVNNFVGDNYEYLK